MSLVETNAALCQFPSRSFSCVAISLRTSLPFPCNLSLTSPVMLDPRPVIETGGPYQIRTLVFVSQQYMGAISMIACRNFSNHLYRSLTDLTVPCQVSA